MFAKYAAIVKNLRGVLVSKELADKSPVLDWISKRFKYRNIGIPFEIWDELPSKYKNKFLDLHYPINELINAEKLIRKIYHIDWKLGRAVTMASIYISPLIIIDNNYRKSLSNHILNEILIDRALDDKMWKLHFRIADYTILDIYKQCVDEAMEIINLIMTKYDSEHVRRIIESRLDKINVDVNRYWRIKSKGGIPFLSYIDNLYSLVNAYDKGEIDSSELNLEYAPTLSIIPILWLTKDNIKNYP